MRTLAPRQTPSHTGRASSRRDRRTTAAPSASSCCSAPSCSPAAIASAAAAGCTCCRAARCASSPAAPAAARSARSAAARSRRACPRSTEISRARCNHGIPSLTLALTLHPHTLTLTSLNPRTLTHTHTHTHTHTLTLPRLGFRQLAAHAAAAELAPLEEESAAAAAVNAWAAAGFKFDRPVEVEETRELAAARAEAAGPALTTLQLQAYALEVQEATGVYGRRRARRRLGRRILSGTAALLCSVLTLLGAGFLIWDDDVEARRLPSAPLPHMPNSCAPPMGQQHVLCM